MCARKTKDPLSNNRDLILLEWPKRIENPSEVPSVFSDAVSGFLTDDWENARLVIIPRQSLDRQSSLWLIACRGERFLILCQDKGTVNAHSFRIEQIACVQHSNELLRNALTFTYRREAFEYATVSVPYNRATEELFLPFLYRAFGKPDDFDPTQNEEKHPRPHCLYQEFMALYNYCLDGCLMGALTNDPIAFALQPTADHFWEVRRQGEGLVAAFEEGMFAILFYPCHQEVRLYYFPNDNARMECLQEQPPTYAFYLKGEQKAHLMIRGK